MLIRKHDTLMRRTDIYGAAGRAFLAVDVSKTALVDREHNASHRFISYTATAPRYSGRIVSRPDAARRKTVTRAPLTLR
jgi:hypothetical protein